MISKIVALLPSIILASVLFLIVRIFMIYVVLFQMALVGFQP